MSDNLPDELWACQDGENEPSVDLFATREQIYDWQVSYARKTPDKHDPLTSPRNRRCQRKGKQECGRHVGHTLATETNVAFEVVGAVSQENQGVMRPILVELAGVCDRPWSRSHRQHTARRAKQCSIGRCQDLPRPKQHDEGGKE